jgi:hypothetical protein
MQGVTGMAIRIQFPTIKNIMLTSKYRKIIKAELIIRPIIKRFSDFASIPPKMLLYESDKYHNLNTVIKSADNTTNYGNLSLDYVYPNNSCYSYNITAYINSLLNTNDIENLELLFACPDFLSSLDKLVIGDRLYPENNISLKVYYLDYED